MGDRRNSNNNHQGIISVGRSVLILVFKISALTLSKTDAGINPGKFGGPCSTLKEK